MFQISWQLSTVQTGIKNNLVSSTAKLDPKMRIQLADYLKSVITAAPIIPQSIIEMLKEVLDEYKSENLSNEAKKTGSNSPTPNLMDVEYIYGNTFANKVQQSLSQEELNRFMKSVHENEQSSKMSSARYLTIYLENELKKVAEQFTQHFEKVINQLTSETIDQMNKHK